jgi:hypothetical protein
MMRTKSVPETSYFLNILTRLVKPISVLPDDGMESVPETSYFFNILSRLVAREDFIKSCCRESFKSYINLNLIFLTVKIMKLIKL